MKQTARDVMVTEFNTIRQDASITEAVRLIYNGKVRETGFKTVCTMVTNHFGELVGIVDRMVKDKCRRLPVVEGTRVIEIVYLSEVYCHLCKHWLNIDL